MSGNGSVNGGVRRPWVWAAVFVAAVVVAVAVVMGRAMWGSLQDGPDAGDNPELDAKLNALDVNLDVAQFDSLLGKPALAADKVIKTATVKIRRHAKPRQIIEETKYREYFYVHPHFYVQVITDEAGKVGLYSVTARSPQYVPKINTALPQQVQIGRSVYGDLQATPIKIAGNLEPDRRDSFYYEIYPLAATPDRVVVFSSNTNGYLKNTAQLDEKTSGLMVSRVGPDAEGFPLHEMHAEFRKTTTINTYSVAAVWLKGFDMTSTGANFGSALINFGPRGEQLKPL